MLLSAVAAVANLNVLRAFGKNEFYGVKKLKQISEKPGASVKTWCLLPDWLRSVGLGPVSSPPAGALANEASISARDQSISSAPLSSASSSACSFCQTPAW